MNALKHDAVLHLQQSFTGAKFLISTLVIYKKKKCKKTNFLKK
jgi:hypothetical protein